MSFPGLFMSFPRATNREVNSRTEKKKKEAVTHSIKFPSGSLQYTLLNLPTAPVRSTTFEPSRIYTLKSNVPLADDSHKINQQIGNSLVPHLNPSSLPSGQNLLNRSLRDEAQIATSRLNAFCLGFEFFAREMEIDLLGAEFEGMSRTNDVSQLCGF